MWGVLAGAALGALKAKKDDEDLLKGALLGGVLGGATAGLGNALGGAGAATEAASGLATEELAAQTLADKGMFTLAAEQQAGGIAAEEAALNIAPGLEGTLQHGPQEPSRLEMMKRNFSDNLSSVDGMDAAKAINQFSTPPEQQQQIQPIQPPPLQVAPVATAPSPVQQMARSGKPTFVPKAMFEAEVGGRQEQMERERLLEMLRQRGMA